jgi:hypothetical protein
MPSAVPFNQTNNYLSQPYNPMEHKLHFNIMLIVSLSSVIIMSFLTKSDIKLLAKNKVANSKQTTDTTKFVSIMNQSIN